MMAQSKRKQKMSKQSQRSKKRTKWKSPIRTFAMRPLYDDSVVRKAWTFRYKFHQPSLTVTITKRKTVLTKSATNTLFAKLLNCSSILFKWLQMNDWWIFYLRMALNSILDQGSSKIRMCQNQWRIVIRKLIVLRILKEANSKKTKTSAIHTFRIKQVSRKNFVSVNNFDPVQSLPIRQGIKTELSKHFGNLNLKKEGQSFC